ALALAFFAAILADFRAVAELGWIAGCGVLLCAFACFTVLPSLLTLLDKRSFSESGAPVPLRGPLSHWFLKTALGTGPAGRQHPPMIETWLPILSRRPVIVVGAGLLA